MLSLGKIITSLALPALLASTSVAADAERIFKDALKYTVKVESTVSYPFFNEDKGTNFGAGLLVDRANGWILTNKHVAYQGISETMVRFKGHEPLKASKIYLDPYLDIALLQVDRSAIPKSAQAAELSCKHMPGRGHPVVAFGHPEGLPFTGSRGIISGNTFLQNEYIQTDSSINSGNSGGPLISLQSGQVIGINTARLTGDEVESLNFATPIRPACQVLGLLREGKNPLPPRLPVIFMGHDTDDPKLIVAKAYEEAHDRLQTGDQILAVSGQQGPVANLDQLLLQLRGKQGMIGFDILRNGQRMSVALSLKPHPDPLYIEALAFSGLVLLEKRMLGSNEVRLYVGDVQAASPAEAQGINEWDEVIASDGTEVRTLQQLYSQLDRLDDKHGMAELIIKRISNSQRQDHDYHKVRLKISDLSLVRNGH